MMASAGVIKTRNANPTVPMVVAEFLYEAGPDRGCAGSCCGGCHQGCGPHEDNHGYQCPANATDSAAKRMIMWCAFSSALYRLSFPLLLPLFSIRGLQLKPHCLKSSRAGIPLSKQPKMLS